MDEVTSEKKRNGRQAWQQNYIDEEFTEPHKNQWKGLLR